MSSYSADTPKVALITGTNGISGSALLKQLAKNPDQNPRSPAVPSPESHPTDPRIEHHTLDLTLPTGEIASALSSKNLTNITHFFHYAYIHTDYDDGQHLEKMTRDNVPLFTNVLAAVDLTSRDTLHRVILQTGGKNYGLLTSPPVSEPLTEDAPRVTDPRSLPNFYYPQEDYLYTLSSTRPWTWNITMPFWISGYSPTTLQSWTTTAAIYFSICRVLSQPATFPGGNDEFYGKWLKGQHFSTSWVIGEFTEWIALNENAEVQNQKFNIVDDTVTTFRDVWEGIGRYFGVETRVQRGYDLMGEVKGFEGKWSEIVGRYGGREDVLGMCTWDAFVHAMDAGEWGSVVNMEKARKVGWTKKVDTIKEMEKIFDDMKKDGWIPNV
ncbi:e8bd368e-ad01-4b08-8cc6-f657bb30774d [Sclerotinia trifoliorum]|uniref:E8bd368e-ad01-4b08-8cc6-f657bb30774d n=1 Tax=Sclerotinia trifoliorum TaxID=28548 RepID=A0A8H2VXV9_9HELO|nr:e8bd368e-ad01-4b08-8cc6-f657bb30774d [Sclerotinia trifoliorum]